jgi:hypothetical protein
MSKRNGTLIMLAALAVGAVTVMTKAAQDNVKEPSPGANAAPAAEAGRTPFKGELIVVSMKDAQYGNAMTNPRIEQIANELFITGTGLDSGDPSEWTAGATVRVPLREVSHIAEFDKAEKYRKVLRGNQRPAARGNQQGEL